jgi:glycerol-3-phosphate dehydrogenase
MPQTAEECNRMRRDIGILRDGIYDLLIVGGGSTGAGVALDAASRGFRVALIEKGDFASATSSASSKLVHGGLRYLEHGDIRLVYEALHERRHLLENAPQLAHPLRFILPFYRHSRLPRWKGRVGLWMYDLLAGSHNLSRSRDLSRLRIQRAFPALIARDLLGGVEYFDAQMDDARLGLELIHTAALHGAAACNYVEAMSLDRDRVQARDVLTGATLEVRARQILNAAGPWVDRLRRMAGAEQDVPLLEPTKGVHAIVAGTPFANGGEPRSRNTAFTLLHPRDGRVFFVLPWMGHTLLGTTDTFCEDAADRLTVSANEEDYLLEGYNHHFAPALTRAHIRGRFAGLRPLLRSAPNDPSSRSREYRLIDGPNGLLSVAGGKWTTYRHMAEVVTDRIAVNLGRRRACRTLKLRLNGAPATPWQVFAPTESARIAATFGWSESTCRHLVNRYGERAADVAKMIRDRDECRPVVEGEADIIGEWEYQRLEEMAVTRSDHLLRRSRIGMWHPELLDGDILQHSAAGANGTSPLFP